MEPNTTVQHGRLVILPDDPAIGKPKGWTEYRETWDESLLELTGEPTRYECRPFGDLAQRCFASGVFSSTKNLGLYWLASIRVGLVMIHKPDGTHLEFDKRRDYQSIAGVLVLSVGAIERVLPREADSLETAVTVLGDVIVQMSQVTVPLPSDSG